MVSKKLKKIASAIVSGALSLTLAAGGVELYLRYQLKNQLDSNPFRHNPIIAAQTDEGGFFPDPEIGHRLPPPFADKYSDEYDFQADKEARETEQRVPYSFIGDNQILSLEEVIENAKQSETPVVLNMGDSSTSGWDSNIITWNNTIDDRASRSHSGKPISPFFRYPTYSQILGENDFTVINAGVPGYSSTQGKRYLERLLETFEEKGVKINYATIYFGNNDSVSNANIEDDYVLPEGEGLKVFGLLKRAVSGFAIYTRVPIDEYEDNLREMIRTCEEYGVEPILIRPVIPKRWYPGMRAEGEEVGVWRTLYETKGTKVATQLRESIELYETAERRLIRAATKSERLEAVELYEEAQEHDYMVPRIKREYVEALERVAEETQTPLIDVQNTIPTRDQEYFVDYCHPIELANQLIAEGIASAIK